MGSWPCATTSSGQPLNGRCQVERAATLTPDDEVQMRVDLQRSPVAASTRAPRPEGRKAGKPGTR